MHLILFCCLCIICMVICLIIYSLLTVPPQKPHTASPRWLIMFTVYQNKPSIIFLVIWNDIVQTNSETKCPWIPTLPLLLLHYPYFSYITPMSPPLPLFLLHDPYIAYILVINLLLFFTMLRVLEVSIHGFLTWQASSLSYRPSGHVIFFGK